MGDATVINRFLDFFSTYIESGFGLVGGEVGFLSTTLIVIDMTIAGLFWAWGADDDVMHRLVKKILYVGFFAFLIGNFAGLARIVFESFAGLGLKAGGGGMTLQEFMQPGSVAAMGFRAGDPLLRQAGELMGVTSFFANFVQIAVLMLAWVIVLIAFFVMAIQVFVVLIEFKLTTLAGFVLMPFALFNKTAFLAERVMGNIISSGIKVLVLAVITAIGIGLFTQALGQMNPETFTAEQAMSLALAAMTLLGLTIFAPGLATGLVSGAPQLGAGAAVGATLAVGGAALAAGAGGGALVGGGAAALGAGARMGSAAASGAAHAAGAASSSYSLASLGKTGASAVASGLGGVGKAAAGAVVSPLRRAAAQASESIASSFRTGARAAFENTGGTVAGGGSTAEPAGAPTGAPVPSQPPAWATAMKRRQTISHGASAATHVVSSGERGGGSASVDLSQKD